MTATIDTPRPDSIDPNRPMCPRCGHYRVVWSQATAAPAKHGLCTSCRALDMGLHCQIDGCRLGATYNRGKWCTLHRRPSRRTARVTNIVQHAFAFARWTHYTILAPSDGATKEWFAWCPTCNDGGQADDAEHAHRWARDHNRRRHP